MSPKAFVLSSGSDTGGTAIRSHEAFVALRQRNPPRTEWQLRSMVTSLNYLHYGQDLVYSPSMLMRAYDDADVVVHNSTMFGHQRYDNGQGKPTVLQHHGLHKGHFEYSLLEAINHAAALGALQIGTTVNLELFSLPQLGTSGVVRWVPTPYDLDALANLRASLYQPHPEGRIRFVHAPTNREVKSTAAFIAATNQLIMEGYPIEAIIIEGQTNEETLRTKAAFADVLVDQLRLGYGCNAIEAWAMGIPVIGGVQDHPDWRAHMAARFGLARYESPTGLPFYEAHEGSLKSAMMEMVMYPGLRDDWGHTGLLHASRHHSQLNHVDVMSEVLDAARRQPTMPGPVRRRYADAGRFSHAERLAMLRESNARRKSLASQPSKPEVT